MCIVDDRGTSIQVLIKKCVYMMYMSYLANHVHLQGITGITINIIVQLVHVSPSISGSFGYHLTASTSLSSSTASTGRSSPACAVGGACGAAAAPAEGAEPAAAAAAECGAEGPPATSQSGPEGH